MNSIFYIIGVVVVLAVILRYVGLYWERGRRPDRLVGGAWLRMLGPGRTGNTNAWAVTCKL